MRLTRSSRIISWHWRAFLAGGGSAIWLLAYGVFFWASRLSLDSFSSFVLYLGYLFLLALVDFLVTGMWATLCQSPKETYADWVQERLDSSQRTGLCGACTQKFVSTEQLILATPYIKLTRDQRVCLVQIYEHCICCQSCEILIAIALNVRL